jgi:hypothetical protein
MSNSDSPELSEQKDLKSQVSGLLSSLPKNEAFKLVSATLLDVFSDEEIARLTDFTVEEVAGIRESSTHNKDVETTTPPENPDEEDDEEDGDESKGRWGGRSKEEFYSEVDLLLPKLSNKKISELLNCSISTISRRRRLSGLPKRRQIRKNPEHGPLIITEDFIKTLGTMKDEELGSLHGCSGTTIGRIRRQYNIIPFRTSNAVEKLKTAALEKLRNKVAKLQGMSPRSTESASTPFVYIPEQLELPEVHKPVEALPVPEVALSQRLPVTAVSDLQVAKILDKDTLKNWWSYRVDELCLTSSAPSFLLLPEDAIKHVLPVIHRLDFSVQDLEDVIVFSGPFNGSQVQFTTHRSENRHRGKNFFAVSVCSFLVWAHENIPWKDFDQAVAKTKIQLVDTCEKAKEPEKAEELVKGSNNSQLLDQLLDYGVITEGDWEAQTMRVTFNVSGPIMMGATLREFLSTSTIVSKRYQKGQ